MKGGIKMRGGLTTEIQTIAIKYINREISLEELRLIPYVQYVLVNGSHLDRARINPNERIIIDNWQKDGFLDKDFQSIITVTKEFWDFMNEILWESYVEIKKEVKMEEEQEFSEEEQNTSEED